MKKIISFISALVLLASCGTSVEKKEENDSEKIKVVSSIAPISSIANYVWGENVEVTNLVTIGVSPHAFDLSTSDIVKIEKSDLVVTIGYDHIDGFMDKALDGKNILAFSNYIEPLHIEEKEDEHHEDEHNEDEHHEDEHHEDEHHHDHDEDYHIWMSIDNASQMADLIAVELTKINPELEWEFKKNAWNFKAELEVIKNDFAKEIEGKSSDKAFIVFHDAYNNLFESLDIKLNKVVLRENIMQSADAKTIKEIKDMVSSKKVVALFKEPQMKWWEIDSLASEADINVWVLDPIWQGYDKNSYVENLKKNLESINLLYE